jgi:hypothetical protein
MIRYKASDLIKRAEQLADIENSDFISFSEKIALLNEAYQNIYQKGLNKDVNAFVKYINTRDKVIQLPRDFYQLKAITLGHDKDVQPILRRPANASFNTLSYDMINNVIQINGETSGGNICLEYFPTPTSLTFPNKNKPLEISNVLDMHKDVYITKSDSDSIVIESISDVDFKDELTENGISDFLIHMEDDFITFSDSATQYLYSIDSGTLSNTSYPIVIYHNRTYIYDTDRKMMVIPKSNVDFEELDLDLSNCTISIISNDKTKYTGQNYNGGFFINGVHQSFNARKMFYWNEWVYLSDGTNLLEIYSFDKDNIESTQVESAVVNITEINDDTGYGYLGKRMNKYNLVSFYDDTEMNFPNNTYFVFMSYLLALSFKSKQGSDTSQLAMLTEQAEMTFYDSLARDDWGATRITNVY